MKANNCAIRIITLPFQGEVTNFLAEHSEGHSWYQSTIENYQSPVNPIGFELSPFLYGPHANKQAEAAGSFVISPSFGIMEADGGEADPWLDFTTFGSVSGTGIERVLTESSDAGLWKETTFPTGASSLEFEVRFDTASDGDYLAVSFEGQLLRTVANLSNTTGNYRKYIISVSEFSGESGTLTFTLVSRGTTNAIIRLKDFTIIEDGDIDGDGVLNDTEIMQGTDPLSIDTDGDTIPDGAEAPDSDPLLADTDGDGSDDFAERIAGTNAQDADSVFKVSQIQGGKGSFALWWKSVPGKTYRVIWSETPGFTEFEVIANDLTAVGNETSYIDYAKPSANPAKGFYRLQVVE